MAQVKQPADKSHFILPDLGEGVHEAELIKWRVSVGDQVAEHQTLAEMETDKALVEVPSPWAGVVTELCGSEGDIINVGSVLVRYGESSEAPASPAADQAKATESPASEEREDAGTVVGSVNNDGDAPSAEPAPVKPASIPATLLPPNAPVRRASFTGEPPSAGEGDAGATRGELRDGATRCWFRTRCRRRGKNRTRSISASIPCTARARRSGPGSSA